MKWFDLTSEIRSGIFHSLAAKGPPPMRISSTSYAQEGLLHMLPASGRSDGKLELTFQSLSDPTSRNQPPCLGHAL